MSFTEALSFAAQGTVTYDPGYSLVLHDGMGGRAFYLWTEIPALQEALRQLWQQCAPLDVGEPYDAEEAES